MEMALVSVAGGRLSTKLPMVCLPESIGTVKKRNFLNFQIKNEICAFGVKGIGVFERSGGGAGVLERPKFDQSQFDPSTQVLEGGDIGRLRDRRVVGGGDSYRVLLLDDARHSEKLVAKVLPGVVPSVTPDNARKLFYESRDKGVSVVIVTVKEHAEFYSQMMIHGGLRSGIEPDSSTV